MSNRNNKKVNWTQKIINARKRGEKVTTKKLFLGLWAKYDRDYEVREAKQKKRNMGRAFTNAVRNSEYENIRYIGKNSSKSSLFEIL